VPNPLSRSRRIQISPPERLIPVLAADYANRRGMIVVVRRTGKDAPATNRDDRTSRSMLLRLEM
jgi:hypothetical protein